MVTMSTSTHSPFSIITSFLLVCTHYTMATVASGAGAGAAVESKQYIHRLTQIQQAQTTASSQTQTKYYDDDDDDQVFQFLMDYKKSQTIINQPFSSQRTTQVDLELDLLDPNLDLNLERKQLYHREIEEENFTPTTKAYFVELCTTYLLSDQITSDNEISNDEAASFFEYLCDTLPKPSCQNQSIPFHSLSLMIQMQFVAAICPNDFTFLETQDTSCIEELRKEVDAKNSFGYIITDENEDEVESDITQFCSNIYALSTEFHFGTYAPSPSPSFSSVPTLPKPTSSPHPTKTPSSAPSSYPTLTKSEYPTNEPSVSSQPTSITQYNTAFTYMMGFDKEEFARDLSSAGNNNSLFISSGGKDVMDATSDGIVNVLTNLSNSPVYDEFRIIGNSGGSGRGRNLQQDQEQQLEFIPSLPVEHIYTQEAACTPDFSSKSTNCVVLVSEVHLQSSTKAEPISKETVSNIIYNIMKFSMDNDSLRRIIDIDDIIEIKYLSNGNQPPSFPRDRELKPPIGVGGGSIAGITIGSVLFLLLLAFFVGRARARSDDRSIQQDELSDDDYLNEDDNDSSNGDLESRGSDPAVVSTANNGKSTRSRELPLIEENVDSVAKSLEVTGLQFDPASGEVIGSAALSHTSSHKSIGSGYVADDPETPERGGGGAAAAFDSADELVDKLDEAVQAGDWAAVAAIAGDLSQADDISTMSSVHSKAGDISYDPSERSSLAPQDAKRAAQIDKLIAEGDWNAVGATAVAFENDLLEEPSEKTSKAEPSRRGRSLLDFISGPWQSKAAPPSDNVENDDVESNVDPEAPFANFEDDAGSEVIEGEKTAPFTNVNDGLSVSDPSDLSAGEPKSPSKTSDKLLALGTIGVVGAAGAAAYYSESDSATDDDQKQLISSTQKKKRSWTGRFSFRKNKDEDKKVASSSLSLQEDSSVSSWSKGEDSSPDTTLNPYGETTKPSDEMPAEMKAFGEDHGLAAAEQAMEEEYERKQRDLNESNVDGSETDLSQKSSNSLRDELDKAIETGDWAAVEQQTHEMLDAGKQNASQLLSDNDSDAGSEVERWSQDGGPTDNESEAIDDDRIEILEKLIETDDWQGIVDDSQIHSK